MTRLFYMPTMTISMGALNRCSVRPEFIRFTDEEIARFRADGDEEGATLAERMNAICDRAEGKDTTGSDR